MHTEALARANQQQLSTLCFYCLSQYSMADNAWQNGPVPWQGGKWISRRCTRLSCPAQVLTAGLDVRKILVENCQPLFIFAGITEKLEKRYLGTVKESCRNLASCENCKSRKGGKWISRQCTGPSCPAQVQAYSWTWCSQNTKLKIVSHYSFLQELLKNWRRDI